jgi:alanine-glyoxylate transaminase/serine-glyoxylate transaminase/serine-pyruvate transaminase
VHAWGLDLVAEHPALYSDTVSAIRVPDGVDARDVIRIAYERDEHASLRLGAGAAGRARFSGSAIWAISTRAWR